MKIYWSADNVPELKGLDKQEQKRLFEECNKEGRKRIGSAFWIRLIIVIVASAIIAAFLPLGGAIGGAIIGVFVGFLLVTFVQSPAIEAGRLWLQEQGYPKV
ncbi:hypothetical protein I2494_01005 [Budviciaceae bacterium BWR-B9]|uniref:Uncharacterized protein n=1 Tax=Limnobaculum allomyrinae TaxID=2791986 RepID=A0ABS1IKN0_9GAMM|nr:MULTISPECIES: hypothetical protein [Limnobaculum]MBK5142312.1 hypothetical protein [Limnobaculum allomyrinae]MBV7690803.1 hypothetical protein [Limnobaculum sp. M2-1]